tara:strand:- start:246 stop:467 length:222 start_codon:yes stop_codon:yes gene_type:complete
LPDRPDRLVYVAPAQSNIANISVDMKEKTNFFLSFEHITFIFALLAVSGQVKVLQQLQRPAPYPGDPKQRKAP